MSVNLISQSVNLREGHSSILILEITVRKKMKF